MPDFTEILKIAVEQKDWQLICGLYTSITGEPLSAPEIEDKESSQENEFLTKEYSIDKLREQNQDESTEKEQELDSQGVDNDQENIYNNFTAPTRSESREESDHSGRKMRSEPVGSKPLKNAIGVSEYGFVDNLTESLVNPETGTAFSEENKRNVITPRNKRESLGMNDTSLIDVRCSSCGEEQKVSKVLSYGFSNRSEENTWKCNSCNTRKARNVKRTNG